MTTDTHTKTRVVVLTSDNHSENNQFTDVDDYVCTPAHYFSSSEASRFAFDHITIRKESSYATLRRLASHGKYDVFFNLCDGALDEDRAGEDVVLALERLNVPFTGSDSKHYEISKPDMKMIAYSHSIKVAGDVHFTTLPTRSELEKMVQDLSLPLLVKHPSGYSSIGLSSDSKCDNYESLWSKVQEFFGMYQCVMIEEFISGDEATVFVVEAPDGSAKVLNPVMMQFPVGETFKHFDLKWKDFEGMSWLPVKEDDPARDEIMRVGRIAFQEILGGIGTGRCDVRIDRTSNTVYFLEINANSGMFYPPGSEGSADWIMRTDPHFKHDVVATLMIESAIKRHEARQLPFKVTFDKVKGFHLTASRNLCKGTIIFHDEGKPLPVVTKPYVDKHWSDADKELFRRYAWPLSSDHHLYAIWQQDHTTWRPINHSCNPNVVFGQNYSLNCIAHRDILCGEELTMDYATMLDSEMMPFDCHCGAEQCRKHIHADPEVSKKYGENRWARW